jgi:hypothetical protein
MSRRGLEEVTVEISTSDEDAGVETQDTLEDRQLVEDFACLAAEHLRDNYSVVVLLPWASGSPPAGVLVPSSETGLLDVTQLDPANQDTHGILVCCTFKSREEEVAASEVIKQLRTLGDDICILAAHLLRKNESDAEIREIWENLMRVHQKILKTGFDDVLLDPDTEPSQLRLRLNIARHTWQTNQQQLAMIKRAELEPTPADELQRLEKQHQELLWEHIPHDLMPHFRKLQEDLIETEDTVGLYKLLVKKSSRHGDIWEAIHEGETTRVIVKVIEKAAILLPSEVEGINREYRFLKSFIDHRHVVKALDLLHGPKNVYIVLDYAGRQNLAQHLNGLPGFRMEHDVALSVFWQIVAALAHCHSKEISHRSLALEHVVLNVQEDGYVFAKLVDFHAAMVAKFGVTSKSICGSLPYMSPEMLIGGSYTPSYADSWSAGVVLLEMAGGIGAFLQALQINLAEAEYLPAADAPDRIEAANAIKTYFSQRGNISWALTCTGASPRQEIVDILAVLLVEESTRMSMQEMDQIKPQL